MKRTQLLFCSALLLAPISGLLAEDADTTPDPLPSAERISDDENPFENLSVERSATALARKITAKNKARYLSSNPLANASAFKPKPDFMLARLKEGVEPGVSEKKDKAPKPTAASEADGKFASRHRVAPSNT